MEVASSENRRPTKNMATTALRQVIRAITTSDSALGAAWAWAANAVKVQIPAANQPRRTRVARGVEGTGCPRVDGSAKQL
ncbi:hypothetical protein GCM10027417_00580 [Glutamicibacter endophyticus]